MDQVSESGAADRAFPELATSGQRHAPPI